LSPLRWASALALVVTLGCGTETPDPVVESAVAHGALLFGSASLVKTTQNSYACATCHAVEVTPANDAILPGVTLAGVTKRPSFWNGMELDLLAAMNHCAYSFMLKDAPFTATDENAKAVYAYLESLPSSPELTLPQPFTVAYTVADVPSGDATRGEALYRRACTSCHGPKSTGTGRLVKRAPVLPEQTVADHPSDKYTRAEVRLVFVEKVRHGGFVGYGGQMPPFAREKLSDQELGDILEFLDVR